jgi:hypothetical protein
MRQQAPTWLHAMKKLLILLLLLPALAIGQSYVEETKALAESGNPIAQYNLGVMYDCTPSALVGHNHLIA